MTSWARGSSVAGFVAGLAFACSSSSPSGGTATGNLTTTPAGGASAGTGPTGSSGATSGASTSGGSTTVGMAGAPMGGASSAGGSSVGTGAAGAGASQSGAGGVAGVSSAGSGPVGSAGAAGTTAGMGGVGGTGSTDGGAGAGGGGAAEWTPGEFLGALDGYLYTGDCNGGSASFECPLTNCTGNVFEETAEFVAQGDPGTVYDVTLHVYGVVELRSDYAGGERRQGSSSNAMSADDFLYEGGSYTPGAGYNVYGLAVTPAVADVANASDGANNYFLNARDSSGEGHEVWKLDYEVTLPINGGGTITFTAYDPNCLQIMNNSETARPSGDGPGGSIVISEVESADPPPSDFVQPLSNGGRNGQWVFIDVLDVQAR